MKQITALLLAFIIVFCSCSAETTDYSGDDSYSTQTNREERIFVSAVWLSYREIASLSDGKDEKEFRNEIINLAANLLSSGINTIIVHAIPFCDSFYESDILPRSKRLDKNINYDVFKIISELCSHSGIDVQAWINPYRVSNSSDISVINDNPTVKELYTQSKDNLIINENEIYLNPASISAQKLILLEVGELIEKYNISAIHIDDYFYPDMSSFPDRKSFEEYKKSGGQLCVEDWRRENVNTLISSLHSLVCSHKKSLAVSPAPDIEKNYNTKYADISFWLENGWADYIMPQIYFGFENEKMPFEKVLENWIKETKDKKTKLVIGLAAYKCGEEDSNAGSGKNEWLENNDILSRQISLILQKNTIYGVALFSYSYIFDKKIEKITKKELQTIKSML